METIDYNYENLTEINVEPPNEATLERFVNLGGSLIFLLISLICNSLIFVKVVKNPNLKQLPYIFIACIAVCDVVANIGYLFSSLILFKKLGMGLFTCSFLETMSMYPEFLKLLLIFGIAVYKVSDRTALMGKKGVGKSVLLIFFLALICAGLCAYPILQIRFITYEEAYFCDYNYKTFNPELYSLIKGVCFFIIFIIVLTCLLVSRRRRRDEVAEVDDDGLIVKNPQKADERFEVMIIIVLVVFLLTTLIIELVRKVILPIIMSYYFSSWIQTYFLFVEPLIIYPEKFYKLFLYKSKDAHFQKEYKPQSTKDSEEEV